MTFFSRDLSETFQRYSKFPVIAILGPRQSGKTTLTRNYFKNHAYVNLENPELRAFAIEDPNRFLKTYSKAEGLIIDEFQYAPKLLSYIQVIVDEIKRPGYFVITGSQNFLMNESISQSLAGRVGILTLLPLSLHEMKANALLKDIDSTILEGSYPRLYEEKIASIDLYPSYIHTYLERDVRQIASVGDLSLFQKFMRLCAARIGQLLNISDLSTNLGVDQRKIKEWLSVLESSYIIFLLKPHFQNFNKRLTKTPKIYFYDTGLASSLLEIKTTQSLALSPLRGHLFESLIMADFHKQYYNQGMGQPPTYFWRDQNGLIEVDCILDRGDHLVPIEIKSSETISSDFFSSLTKWCKIANEEQSFLIYAGDLEQERKDCEVLSWKGATTLVSKLWQK